MSTSDKDMSQPVDVYATIFDALSLGLKQNKFATTPNHLDSLQVECEFQGNKRNFFLHRPVEYKELLSKIRAFCKRNDVVVYSASRYPQASLRVQSQNDLDALFKRSDAGASLKCCRLLVLSEEQSLKSLVPSGGGGHHSWSGVLSLASNHGDRESPPPGTLPQMEKLALVKHSMSCPTYSEGMFIPDEEDDVISVGSALSNSRSSIESFSSSHSAPGTVSGRSVGASGSRVHSGTYPKTKTVGDRQNIPHESIPPYTYPRHGRLPTLPATGSFGSITSSGSVNSSLRINKPLKSTWKRGRSLGSGPVGQVVLCYEEETGREMAAKIVEIATTDDRAAAKEVKDLECDIQLLKGLRHDRIIRYYGSHDDGHILSIFMEYITGGSVTDQIREYGPLTEQVCRRYCRQILEGLVFLHDLKIVHRDIKGSNILRDHDGNIKLSDFGTLKRLQTIVGKFSKGTGTPWIGTLHYLAPEVIEGGGNNYGRKSDIWSLGCTVIEMLTGKPPWHELTGSKIISKIINHSFPFYSAPVGTSDLAKSFVLSCFPKNKTERWSADKLLAHGFVYGWDGQSLAAQKP